MSREEVSAERLRHIQIASAETEGKKSPLTAAAIAKYWGGELACGKRHQSCNQNLITPLLHLKVIHFNPVH